MTMSVFPTLADGSRIDGLIGFQYLFYSLETAQNFVDNYCPKGTFIEEVCETPLGAPSPSES